MSNQHGDSSFAADFPENMKLFGDFGSSSVGVGTLSNTLKSGSLSVSDKLITPPAGFSINLKELRFDVGVASENENGPGDLSLPDGLREEMFSEDRDFFGLTLLSSLVEAASGE